MTIELQEIHTDTSELERWACDKCGERFAEPDGKHEMTSTDPPHDETFAVCPHCGSCDVEEVTASMRALSVLVPELVARRKELEDARAVVERSMSQFREDHKAEIEAESLLRDAVSTLEYQIKEAAIGEFERTTSKKPMNGIGIRVTRRPDYPRDKALEWAQENARMFLLPESLNTKAFDKHCVSTTGDLPDFVTIEEIATVTISPNLEVA